METLITLENEFWKFAFTRQKRLGSSVIDWSVRGPEFLIHPSMEWHYVSDYHVWRIVEYCNQFCISYGTFHSHAIPISAFPPSNIYVPSIQTFLAYLTVIRPCFGHSKDSPPLRQPSTLIPFLSDTPPHIHPPPQKHLFSDTLPPRGYKALRNIKYHNQLYHALSSTMMCTIRAMNH